jgi:restriction endonuclease
MLPRYDEFYAPLLHVLKDGNTYTMKEVKKRIAENLHLPEDALLERLASGRQSVYDNRIGWAKTYLQKAGVVVSPKRAQIMITDRGKALLSSGETITNALLEEKYPEFAEFCGKKSSDKVIDVTDTVLAEETPQEVLDRVYGTINEQLADDLLIEIMGQSAKFFEILVVDLMKAMNYGDGFVTKLSGDDGIDGIIHEDKLGFNLIYIQAKRWNPDTTIGKPEIQKFAGAMMGPPKVEKGLFITTAKFSQGAKDYANAQHIILVDGRKLTELMIEHELGVSTQKSYRIKRIDSDYFTDN